jgi:hypothetical protein
MSIALSTGRTPFIPMAAQAPYLPQNSGVTGATAAAGGEGIGDTGKADDDIRKAAESFEAIILRQLLASMRKAKLSEDVFGLRGMGAGGTASNAAGTEAITNDKSRERIAK